MRLQPFPPEPWSDAAKVCPVVLLALRVYRGYRPEVRLLRKKEEQRYLLLARGPHTFRAGVWACKKHILGVGLEPSDGVELDCRSLLKIVGVQASWATNMIAIGNQTLPDVGRWRNDVQCIQIVVFRTSSRVTFGVTLSESDLQLPQVLNQEEA